jgi:hypothetical protein
MFIRPASDIPHPHELADEPDPDAEARCVRITRAIADIGRRNDEIRRRIAENWKRAVP